MDANEVRLKLDRAAGENRSEYARKHSLSPAYVNDVLRGQREPGKKVLDSLGLEKVVSYRRKAKEESK